MNTKEFISSGLNNISQQMIINNELTLIDNPRLNNAFNQMLMNMDKEVKRLIKLLYNNKKKNDCIVGNAILEYK